ncbi:hypothetical protein DFH09DRAFT_1079105 [Mycena vulgaris]|nr:hypothetical protein DFH09DRAFT_1079105 [Mycena vulgaris]
MHAPKALSFNPLAAVLLGAPQLYYMDTGGPTLERRQRKVHISRFREPLNRITHPTCKGKFFLEKKAADRPTPLSSEMQTPPSNELNVNDTTISHGGVAQRRR